MNQTITKQNHLFILSDNPTLLGEIALLLGEVDLSYMIHILFFQQPAWEKQRYSQEDVILFDVSSFLELPIRQLRMLRSHSPTCKILVLGRKLSSATIYQLIQLGINGYLSKDNALASLNEAIQVMQKGRCYLPANIGADDILPPSPAHKLPQRELQVLTCMSQGMSSPKIAEQLFISVHTVHTYRKRLFKRFNVNRAPSLIKVATSGGYL